MILMKLKVNKTMNKEMLISVSMMEDIKNLFGLKDKPYIVDGLDGYYSVSFLYRDLQSIYLNKEEYLKFKEKYEKYGFKIRIGSNNKKFNYNPEADIKIYNGNRIFDDDMFVGVKRYNNYCSTDTHKTIKIVMFSY
jgi:hypothetical protein